MKKWLMLLGLPCALMAGVRTKDEYHALSHGAEACAALKIIDDTGTIVTNATVMGNFHMHDGKGNPFTGHTDTCGVYVASGKCVGDWHYVIKKAGHYETSVDVRYFGPTNTSVRNGRWQPYGMTNTVVLKRRVNPVAMCAADRGSSYTLIPLVGEPLGFDLKVGDWVSPHGRGKTRDFDVTYIRDGSGRAFTSQELILSVRDPFGGFKKVSCDTYSAFKSPYRAETNAVYEQEVRFCFKRPGGTGGYIDGQMKADECVVLRTRTRIDTDGQLIGAHYGKIYGPLCFGISLDAPGEMKILHYLNPNENDPNLEADTTQNLLNPGDLSFAP